MRKSLGDLVRRSLAGFAAGVMVASALALSIGIAIQNFPEGAIVSMPLKAEGESKGKTVILSKAPLDEAALRAVIDGTGYRAGSVTAAPYEKKEFFHFGKK